MMDEVKEESVNVISIVDYEDPPDTTTEEPVPEKEEIKVETESALPELIEEDDDLDNTPAVEDTSNNQDGTNNYIPCREPRIKSIPMYDYDLTTAEFFEDKPWSKPGTDITDYFNYGFNEQTWAKYCDKQRQLRITNAGGAFTGVKPILPKGSIAVIGANMDSRRPIHTNQNFAMPIPNLIPTMNINNQMLPPMQMPMMPNPVMMPPMQNLQMMPNQFEFNKEDRPKDERSSTHRSRSDRERDRDYRRRESTRDRSRTPEKRHRRRRDDESSSSRRYEDEDKSSKRRHKHSPVEFD